MTLLALRCPECGSDKLYKDGLRYLTDGKTSQRWLCCRCSYRFSPTDSNRSEKPEHVLRVSSSVLNPPSTLRSTHQILRLEAINLVDSGTRLEKAQREGTTHTNDMKAKIIDHAFWMRKEGYAEATITRRIRLLTTLTRRGANLFDPESVKETLAKQQEWSLKTKAVTVDTYTCFLRMLKGTWEPPKYKPVRKLPFIPTEQELSELIAGCNRKTSAFLQLLKETGMRSGEAWMLRWTDFSFENKTVSVTPEKGSEPRLLRMSSTLAAMLNNLPKDRPETFKGSLRHFARSFRRQRTRIAHKLENNRIAKITFHTFRHWKATMEYAKTKDILHVMKMLGHRNIQNTLLYTQLVNFETDDFHSATAATVQEAQKLIEAGFEYVCSFDQVRLFRKRK